MTLFRFCHAQKNAFAFFVVLTSGEVAVGLRGLDFRLPVAPCSINRLLMIFPFGGHAALKRKDLQTAQQKLSERQRRGIHVKAWGNAPGLRKSENISAESAIHTA
jgi:hypothetical protein